MRIAVRLIACLVVLLALSACPRASDALLGKVRALTYLGQAVEAIAAVDQLLGERWHLGDARYWRALNEPQLERYEGRGRTSSWPTSS